MASNAPAAKPHHGHEILSLDKPHIEVANTGLVVAGIMLASVMQLIDATIANVAIPHMQTALGAAPDTVTWVLTSYIIASAVAMPITGWLADRFGSRRLMLAAVTGFIATSILCGLAQRLGDMVIYRALQGASGAFLLPLGQSIMLDITPRRKHAQMMALWGGGIVLGPIIGPILGGYLTEYASWRWVFFVNVPLGLVAFAILFLTLPQRPLRKRPFDLAGFALIAIMLTSLQLLLDRGPHIAWFEALESWLYLLVAISCAWMVVIHVMTAKHPLFERELFANRNLVIATLFLTVVGFVMFSAMALLPPMLQGLMGYDAIDTGLLLTARGIGVLASMQVASRFTRPNIDTRLLVTFGFLVTAYSFHMMSQWSLEIETSDIFISGLVQGLGMGFVFIPLNTLAFATLPPHYRTEASSLTNLARSVGSSIGIAVMAFMLTRSIQTSHADLGAHVTENVTNMFDLSTIDRFQGFGSAGLVVVDAEINRQAAMIGYINDYYIMMWMVLLSTPLIVLMKRAPQQGH